jgi:hypothetical protein
MCVTNTTLRRLQTISLPTATGHVGGGCSSALAQDLLGTFALPVTKTDFSDAVVPKKRRRKPQKPGMTAKMNERHFVEHNYHDHAGDVDDRNMSMSDFLQEHRGRGGNTTPFASKLHQVLDQVEQDGLSHVISWQPHGRCFVIHKPKEFVEEVMPRYVCTSSNE